MRRFLKHPWKWRRLFYSKHRNSDSPFHIDPIETLDIDEEDSESYEGHWSRVSPPENDNQEERSPNDIDTNSCEMRNLFQTVILSRDEDKISVLLDYLGNDNLDINYVDIYGDTALHLVCSHLEEDQCEKVISKILEHPLVNVNIKNDQGRTPLFILIEKRFKKAIEVLLGHSKTDPNISRCTSRLLKDLNSLHLAIIFGETEIVKLLLKSKKIDVNRVIKKRTALDRAQHLFYKDESIVMDKLLKIFSTSSNKAPILKEYKEDMADIIGLLLDHKKLNPNIIGLDGSTALIKAVDANDKTRVKKLISNKKLNPNIILKNGRTALFLAVEKRRYEMVSLLSKFWKVKPNKKWMGITPLYHAVMENDLEMVKRLKDCGKRLNPNIRSYGHTPLHKAFFNGSKYMIQVLLNFNNIRVDIPDEFGIRVITEVKEPELSEQMNKRLRNSRKRRFTFA